MKIGIDLDLTVYASDWEWMEWLRNVSGELHNPLFTHSSEINYDLSKYYTMPHEKVNGYDFWRNPYLYYGMPLILGAKQAIDGLHILGHDIYFISSIKGAHARSKYYQTKHHFPYMKGCSLTKEKGVFGEFLDVFIDDRNSNLNQMPEHVKLIKMNTPYTQEEELTREHKVMYNWYELPKLLEE